NFQIDIVQHLGGAEMFSDRAKFGTVAKLAMRQPFVLFKGLTFQKLCLPGAFCLIQRPYVSKTLLTRRISPRGSP
ncbi:hypothetical protein, partial [Acinetobacter baumannii]|uniref:hypothetical protein n=1 Tax=Acinetobacter baumannii TaxID=470 RepID=UPI001A8E7F2F